MTFFELQEALREACPEDRKLTITIVTGLATFSSVPANKDSKDQAVRTFPITDESISQIPSVADIPLAALESLYGEEYAYAYAKAWAEKHKAETPEVETAKSEFASKREEKRVTSQRAHKAK